MISALRQRQPRQEDVAFLAFVRRHRCCSCQAPAPSQAAHVRMASAAHGKRSTGIGERPDDKWAVPLCADCHLDGARAQHRIGERAFWAEVCVDPFRVAEELYRDFKKGGMP